MGKLNSIVRQIIVECAHIYQRTFVDYDYLVCSFATATDDFTLGFSIGKTAKPKSLLKGNFIQNRDNHLDLVIRRPHGQQLFSDVIVGNKAMLEKHLRDIKPLLSDSLIAQTCIYRRIRLSRSRGC